MDIAQRIESVHTLKASEKHISFGVTLSGDVQGARMPASATAEPASVRSFMNTAKASCLKAPP